MPVQINELVIRANVQETESKGTEKAAKAPAAGDVDKEEIVKECVDLVLEVLKNKNQR